MGGLDERVDGGFYSGGEDSEGVGLDEFVEGGEVEFRVGCSEIHDEFLSLRIFLLCVGC